MAVGGAAAFGEDDERQAGLQRFDAAEQAGDGGAGAGLSRWGPGRSGGGTSRRRGSSRGALGEDAELEGQLGEEDGRVHVAEVVGGVDGDVVEAELFGADEFDGREAMSSMMRAQRRATKCCWRPERSHRPQISEMQPKKVVASAIMAEEEIGKPADGGFGAGLLELWLLLFVHCRRVAWSWVQRQFAECADEVDGAGGEDEAVGWGDVAGECEGFGGVGGGWAGMSSAWAAASRASTRAARGESMGARMMWWCGRGVAVGEESKRGRGSATSRGGPCRGGRKRSGCGAAISGSEAMAARRVQAPAGLWATSRRRLGGEEFEAAGPGGVGDAGFELAFGMLELIGYSWDDLQLDWLRSSMAAAMARAMLRCWCWPARGERTWRGWPSRGRV